MEKEKRKQLYLLATNNAGAAIAAGYPLSAAIAAGYSKEEVEEWDSIPINNHFYSDLLKDINEKRVNFRQSTFGSIETFEESCEAKNNLCKTPMCTAGHWVFSAGKIGYDLKKKYGFAGAANILHAKSYPDLPAQNFDSIPQQWALAYIEEMAEIEKEREKK